MNINNEFDTNFYWEENEEILDDFYVDENENEQNIEI